MLAAFRVACVALLSTAAAAFSTGNGVVLRSSSSQPLLRARASPAIAKIPIVDDVLDYLTNMGGYTGFTEDQLKGGKQLTQEDVKDFGVERETDETVTTIFVILLIATPFIVGAIGFSLGVFVVPSFVPK